MCVVVELLRDGKHDDLLGREPQRELAAGVLEQHGHEALHRAERRAVDHDRAVELVVGALVRQVEALREVVVHLDGAQLPLAADGVLDHEVEFWSVEGSFAVLHDRVETLLLGGLHDGRLGLLPVLVRTDVLLAVVRVTQRNLCRIAVELQRAEDIKHDVDHALELLEQLVGADKQVGVVLSETAHSGQSVELARLLVAVDRSELGQTDRQLLVRTGLRTVDLAVVRAVHRLEQVLLTLDRGVDRLEGVLAVLGIVARGDVELLVADVRGDDLLVAVLLLHVAQELLQTVAQCGALRQPERKTLAHALREGEQFEVLAQLAVVALLGLFHHLEVLVEHRLLGERDAVDTREHLVLLVAAPVGSGHGGQLDGLDVARVGNMRAAAEVRERTVRIEGDGTVLEVRDELDLVLVALFGESLEGFGLGDLAADELLLVAGELLHLLFDSREIGFGDGRRGIDVVVESVLDGGADAELDARVEVLEGLGQQVRRRVPEGVLALVVVPLVEFDRSVGFDRARHVYRRAVYRGRQRVSS